MITDEIPTVTAELERKVVELLETLVHRTETNRMDKGDLWAVGKALWNITSGLVSDEVSTLCSTVADAGKTRILKRQFIGDGRILTVSWTPNGIGYVILSHNATTQERKTVRISKSEIGIRETELSSLFAVLLKTGYLEI